MVVVLKIVVLLYYYLKLCFCDWIMEIFFFLKNLCYIGIGMWDFWVVWFKDYVLVVIDLILY